MKVTIYICNPHDVTKARSILPGLFRRRSSSQYALCAAWTGKSKFPAGNQSNRASCVKRVCGVLPNVRLRGQRGHDLLHCKCPLMTQSGHQGSALLDPPCPPWAWAQTNVRPHPP